MLKKFSKILILLFFLFLMSSLSIICMDFPTSYEECLYGLKEKYFLPDISASQREILCKVAASRPEGTELLFMGRIYKAPGIYEAPEGDETEKIYFAVYHRDIKFFIRYRDRLECKDNLEGLVLKVGPIDSLVFSMKKYAIHNLSVTCNSIGGDDKFFLNIYLNFLYENSLATLAICRGVACITFDQDLFFDIELLYSINQKPYKKRRNNWKVLF